MDTLTAVLGRLDDDALANGRTQIDVKACGELVLRAAAIGAVPCTRGSCRNVKPKSAFTARGVNKCWCKQCNSRAGQRATAEWQFERDVKLARLIDKRPKVRNTVAIEDAFTRWLHPRLKAAKLSVGVAGEFRRHDMLYRLKRAIKAVLWRLQLKAATLGEDGYATFTDTFRYGAGESAAKNAEHAMPVLCGLIKIDDATGDVVGTPKLWLVDGRKIPTSTIHTSASDSSMLCFGKNTELKSMSLEDVIQQLCEWADESHFPSTTYAAAWCDVEMVKHRKELFGMYAFRCVDERYEIWWPKGNQTCIDSWLDVGQGSLETQNKTMASNGEVAICCRNNGVSARPYDAGCGIKQLVAQLVVKSGENFYLLYAALSLDELTEPRRFSTRHDEKNTVFATRNAAGQVEYPGRGKILSLIHI